VSPAEKLNSYEATIEKLLQDYKVIRALIIPNKKGNDRKLVAIGQSRVVIKP